MHGLRGLLAISLISLLAFGAIGCSSNDGNGVLSSLIPADVVRAAPEKVEEAKTLKFEMKMAFEGLDLSAIEDDEDDEDDLFGFGALFLGLFADGITINGSMDFENNLVYTKFNFGFLSGEEIVADGKCYSKSSFFGGSKWTVSEHCEGAGFDGFFDGLDGGPTGFLQELQEEADSVEDLGASEMHGVPAQHYRAYFTDPELEGQVEEYPVPVDIWFDAEGRPLRVQVEIKYREDADEMGDFEGFTDGPISAIVTMDFFDYGKPVDIEIPGEDDIEEAPDFGFDFGSDDDEDWSGSSEDFLDESYVDAVCLNRKWFANDVDIMLDEGLTDEQTAQRYATLVETLALDMESFARAPGHAEAANNAYVALLEEVAEDVRANGMSAVEDPTRIPFDVPADVMERLQPFVDDSFFCEGQWFND